MQKKAIALRFDDGHKYGREIFRCLEKYHVKAPFFLSGKYLPEYGSLYREVSEAGNELANHTYSHSYVEELTDTSFQKELDQVQQL